MVATTRARAARLAAMQANTPSRLLTIPLELRQIIYNEVIFESSSLRDPNCLRIDPYQNAIFQKPSWSRRLTYGRIEDPWAAGLWYPITLLLTCRQIHDEIASIVYRKVKMEVEMLNDVLGDDILYYPSLDNWVAFFHQIGPRLGARIQDLELHYVCHHYYDYDEEWGYETGDETDDEIDDDETQDNETRDNETRDNETGDNETEGNKSWIQLFKNLSYAKVNPKVLTLSFTNPTNPEYYVGDRHSCFRSLAMLFKGLSYCFEKVQRLKLEDRINTLWVFYLRQRYGFIVKRHKESRKCSHWELINPKFFDPSMDLRHFRPSGSIKGIYDKVVATDKSKPTGWF